MPYSFVWLYLLKCVFTCSIFVDSNTKIFLSVLGVFGKYFVSTKTEKFQKQCCPVLVTQSWVLQVVCYSCELACCFWWLVREWKVQSRGVHKDFCGSARDSLASRPSSCKKHFGGLRYIGYIRLGGSIAVHVSQLHFLVDYLPLGGRRKGFTPRSSVSSLITHCCVVLVFASLFPYLCLLFSAMDVILNWPRLFISIYSLCSFSAHFVFDIKLEFVIFNLGV